MFIFCRLVCLHCLSLHCNHLSKGKSLYKGTYLNTFHLVDLKIFGHFYVTLQLFWFLPLVIFELKAKLIIVKRNQVSMLLLVRRNKSIVHIFFNLIQTNRHSIYECWVIISGFFLKTFLGKRLKQILTYWINRCPFVSD